jgi:hypothetical protein
LYGLLLKSRYGSQPDTGLLWYASQDDLHPVALSMRDVAGESLRAASPGRDALARSLFAQVSARGPSDACATDGLRTVGLMMTRNRLAAHRVRDAWQLPPPIQQEHSCKACMVLPLCAVAHRALEGGNGTSFGLQPLFGQLTAHIGDQEAAFLRKWLGLLELEHADARRRYPQQRIWSVDPPPHARSPQATLKGREYESMHDEERPDSENTCPNSQSPGSSPAAMAGLHAPDEAASALAATQGTQPSSARAQHPLNGRSIGSLLLHSYGGCSQASALYPHIYRFRQRPPAEADSAAPQGLPLFAQGFLAGDCGIVSLQGRHAAVNRAQVAAVSADVLTLRLRSRLPPAFEAWCTGDACEGSAAVIGAPSATGPPPTSGGNRTPSAASGLPPVWRLDKDELETAFQCAVSGVLELMVSQTPHASRLRRLIVHFDAPATAARDNFDAEEPADADCVEAMLASECAPRHSGCTTDCYGERRREHAAVRAL